MNYTDNAGAPNAGPPGTTCDHQLGNSLPVLLRRLYVTMREFCPTWEEWQAAVELRPVEQESDPM
jgi:hypothetical protein